MTVWPRETFTDAITPETAKELVCSVTGAVDPVAVMVLLTTPCCTVEVSWVAAFDEFETGNTKK